MYKLVPTTSTSSCCTDNHHNSTDSNTASSADEEENDVGNSSTYDPPIHYSNNRTLDIHDVSVLAIQVAHTPMEIETEEDEDVENEDNDGTTVRKSLPRHFLIGFSMIILSLTFTIPILLITCHTLILLFNVYFILLPFMIHIILVLVTCQIYIKVLAIHYTDKIRNHSCKNGLHQYSNITTSSSDDHSSNRNKASITIIALLTLLDLLLMGYVYPNYLFTFLLQNLFTEVDGTISQDWSYYYHAFQFCHTMAIVSVLVRCCIILVLTIMIKVYSYFRCHNNNRYWSSTALNKFKMPVQVLHVCSILQHILLALILFFSMIVIITLSSAMVHLSAPADTTIPQPSTFSSSFYQCDPLDETECWLPFPSFHMLQKDNTTETGYRVHLQGNLLPPLESILVPTRQI
jgi:hypothetical protein